MKTMKIQNEKRRHIAPILFSLGFILVQSDPVLAAPVEYQMSYNAITELTTIVNDGTSQAPLEFHTLVGPDALAENFQVPIGGTVTVAPNGDFTGVAPGGATIDDINGVITGSFYAGFLLSPQGVCHNKNGFKGPGGVPVATVVSNSATTKGSTVQVIVTPPDHTTSTANLGPGQTTAAGFIQPGDTVHVNQLKGGRYEIFENDITSLSDDSSIIINSPLWLNPDQSNYQLLGGTLDSVDDTSDFSTIFTPTVATGCVPDAAATYLLLILALVVLAVVPGREPVA
jgi:hypothetical protein